MSFVPYLFLVLALSKSLAYRQITPSDSEEPKSWLLNFDPELKSKGRPRLQRLPGDHRDCAAFLRPSHYCSPMLFLRLIHLFQLLNVLTKEMTPAHKKTIALAIHRTQTESNENEI